MIELPSPVVVKKEYPLKNPSWVDRARLTCKEILKRKDSRLAVIVGPCSIHDPRSAIEYATKLKVLSQEIDKNLFPIMRIFIEKPRTRLGWKGMLYDPHLDGSNDIITGIQKSRELMLKIIEIGVPIATELLEPMLVPYFDDLIVWGLIGARTTSSQPHRQMASGLPFPVGFKNDVHGEIDAAIDGIIASRMDQSSITINEEGRIAAVKTRGNPYSHLVLRGAETFSNFDPDSVKKAICSLRKNRLDESLLIDCSHGNCGKDHTKQKIVFESVIKQAEYNKQIAGFMLESHLFEGKQPLIDDPQHLSFGVSITDPCLSWEETATLLRSV